MALLGAGLPVAAAIYPAARSGDRHGHHARREVAALAAYSAWVLASSRADRDRAARLLAAGWASHAAFDALHDGGGHSLIPAWYPALCAGYDVVIAAGLLQRRA
ncbi:hypothetical protein C7Y72_03285 [Paraconexibacter algicola]|uniref:Uncharacterized protein n=1 Tax=Paraconexibacter algicola TaxID=2133960 RepID=A0A2T4UN80_9ACTN|nr:hypothetical protein C7Y72_03285 [Paraconexibacter algicola]